MIIDMSITDFEIEVYINLSAIYVSGVNQRKR